jgi:catalase
MPTAPTTGIHTFRFINRKGKTALVKSASSRGTERSSCPNAEMQLAPRDFLERALIERTKKGPVRWEPGDPEENPTILWPKTREEG